MREILEVVAPVFLIVAAGFLAAQKRVVDEDGFRGMTTFAFYLAVPALLFTGGTSGHAGGAPAALVFITACLTVYGISLIIATTWLRFDLGQAALFALNSSYGNAVMIGIPLIAAAYGQPGLTILLSILALHSLVLLSLGTIIAEVGLHREATLAQVVLASFRGVLRNPVVMAVIVAITWNYLGLGVPAVARRTLELLGAAASPVALFCLGGSLVAYRSAPVIREIVWTVPLKLLVLPLLVGSGSWLLGLSQLEMAVAVTASAMPTGANAFLLARRYAVDAASSGATVLITTALSILTLAVILGLFAAMQ